MFVDDVWTFENIAKREGFYSMKDFCEYYKMHDFYKRAYANDEGVLDYTNFPIKHTKLIRIGSDGKPLAENPPTE